MTLNRITTFPLHLCASKLHLPLYHHAWKRLPINAIKFNFRQRWEKEILCAFEKKHDNDTKLNQQRLASSILQDGFATFCNLQVWWHSTFDGEKTSTKNYFVTVSQKILVYDWNCGSKEKKIQIEKKIVLVSREHIFR